MNEEKFLEKYDSSRFEKPSVTADVVILTVSDTNELEVVLVKRNEYPFKDHLAIPGGFVDIQSDIDEVAKRKLNEKTGLCDVKLEQFATFGKPDRDPRMRIISVAYFALVPKNALKLKKENAALYKISVKDNKILLTDSEGNHVKNLAFDHEEILLTLMTRLKNRIDYTDDLLHLLDEKFTIFEAKNVFEIIKQESVDTNNFRRDFTRKFAGKVEKTDEVTNKYSHRQATIYKKIM